MSHILRPWLSEYWYRRLVRKDVLFIDVYAYDLGDTWVLKYSLSNGGTRKHERDIYFAAPLAPYLTPPRQVPQGAALLVDLELSEPVRFNGLPLNRALADWATRYHHQFLRHLATEYPLPHGYSRRSVRFWYFVNPDHDPAHGFKNWWVANRNHKRLTGLPA